MTAANSSIPMEIDHDEESRSETNTIVYSDENSDSSDDEVTVHNWRYVFQEILNDIHETKLKSGVQSITFDDDQCRIQIKNFGNTFFTFPLSSLLCSRIICEHGIPLPLVNTYDFYGARILNSAWEINGNSIDLPHSLSTSLQTNVFEQLNITSSHMRAYFDLTLCKLLIFGPCSYSKIYRFDDTTDLSLATVVVFLPSQCTGGNYRSIDDILMNDEDKQQYVFNQDEFDKSTVSTLILSSEYDHEIEPIEKGFKLLLVYRLAAKTDKIHQYCKLLYNENKQSLLDIEHYPMLQRLCRIFTYWEKHLDKMPNKLIVPLRSPLDISSLFSVVFHDKYRIIFEMLKTVLKYFPSFLIYSADLQHDKRLNNTSDSRFFINNVTLLNYKSHKLILNLHSEHERTVSSNEFLHGIPYYADIFEHFDNYEHTLSTGENVFRTNATHHVLVLISYENQWDLLLDDPALTCHHLTYMINLPTNSLNNSCLNLFNCILHENISSTVLIEQIIKNLIELRHRFGLTTEIKKFIKILFENKHFRNNIMSNKSFSLPINLLVQAFSNWSMLSMEFLILFYQILVSMPTKLNEVVNFLLKLSHKTLRALLINVLLRYVFKRRTLLKHILLSTLCSILHLLIIDGSYSNDSLLTIAYHIIKRVRKSTCEYEIIGKYFKAHLIPLLINIYREIQIDSTKNLQAVRSLSPAFVLIYEYCLNTLNYYCLSNPSNLSTFDIISTNEALLMCPCDSCNRLQKFLTDSKSSTILFDLSSNTISEHCLHHTLTKFPTLSIEYKHDLSTGRKQTLIISKLNHEHEQQQLCFHLRRLLLQLHHI